MEQPHSNLLDLMFNAEKEMSKGAWLKPFKRHNLRPFINILVRALLLLQTLCKF